MADIIQLHPQDPQPRRIAQIAAAILGGALVAYPTDSSYALGCALGNVAALERIRKIRQTGKDHNFTLVCQDLSEIATYAHVDNWAYRLLRSFTPGPYTFILKATREAPKKMQHPRRRTIGLRIPEHPVARALLESTGHPLMSSTLLLPGSDVPLTDPFEIDHQLGDRLDIVINAGACGIEPTSVLDLSSGSVEIARRGKGDVSVFE